MTHASFECTVRRPGANHQQRKAAPHRHTPSASHTLLAHIPQTGLQPTAPLTSTQKKLKRQMRGRAAEAFGGSGAKGTPPASPWTSSRSQRWRRRPQGEETAQQRSARTRKVRKETQASEHIAHGKEVRFNIQNFLWTTLYVLII